MKNFFKVIALSAALSALLTACNAESSDIATNSTTQSTGDTTVSSVDVENPDFRNVKWGMSKNDVVSIEGEPTSENEFGEPGDSFYRVVYDNTNVVDYTAELCYYFEDDKLTSAEYRFNCDDKTDLQINTMYYNLYKEYTEKYGIPMDSNYIMSNMDYTSLSEPPYIFDENFSFGDTAIYKSEWSNISGASISMSLIYSAMEETDKLVVFDITYKTVSSDI